MTDPFDLSSLYTDPPKVDASGKPKPEDVRVQLNSGIIVKCEVRYDGLDPDGTRRFLIIAEIDWENYFPKTLIVGWHPDDTTLLFRIPGVPDDVASRFIHQMAVMSEHIVAVR